MHSFHNYLASQLDQKLREHKVVVFYDPRSEFEPFFAELQPVGEGLGKLPRVVVQDSLAHLATYTDSYYGLRQQIEPIAALTKPEPLLIYLPGVKRDPRGSVLMEMERAGECYEPQLKRLARNVLRHNYSEGEIDGMLAAETVTYQDIVALLDQGDQGNRPSVLKSLLGNGTPVEMIARWLAEPEHDAAIVDKAAQGELSKLLASRFDFALDLTEDLARVRARMLRYTLLAEFRSDLTCQPPSSLGQIPMPGDKELVKRLRDIAATMRTKSPAAYMALADQIEADLDLAHADIDAACLGTIDTFRFEEVALLRHCWTLVAAGTYEAAAKVVQHRSRSFWADRTQERIAHWQVCRLMAELGEAINAVRTELPKVGREPADWVRAYCRSMGWYRVDQLHRQLEAWLAKVDLEHEGEQAAGLIRRSHEDLLRDLTTGFGEALRQSHWAVPGVLHQTRVYSEVTAKTGGATAYFLVDAMRFEMGAELAAQLDGAKDLTLRPAVAALPSITPVGMAALMPGASSSFKVVEQGGKLGAEVEGASLTGLAARQKWLKTKVADAVDLPLGKVLQSKDKDLAKKVGQASLVLVRSQEIDLSGESAAIDGGLMARQAIDSMVGNLARAVRKLARAGIERFVITADHGHLFALRKEEDMRTDSPGGQTVELHRRCWAGHGGTTPPGTVRLSAAELGYGSDLEFVFPSGLGVFRAGGDLAFHHGSFSLQELIVPVLSLRMPSPAQAQAAMTAELRAVPTRLTTRTLSVQVVPGMFAKETLEVRVVLMSEGEQVGKAGMALDAEFDKDKQVVRLQPRTNPTVVLVLDNDQCKSVRVLVLDPRTDMVLAQSDEIIVAMGI